MPDLGSYFLDELLKTASFAGRLGRGALHAVVPALIGGLGGSFADSLHHQEAQHDMHDASNTMHDQLEKLHGNWQDRDEAISKHLKLQAETQRDIASPLADVVNDYQNRATSGMADALTHYYGNKPGAAMAAAANAFTDAEGASGAAERFDTAAGKMRAYVDAVQQHKNHLTPHLMSRSAELPAPDRENFGRDVGAGVGGASGFLRGLMRKKK